MQRLGWDPGSLIQAPRFHAATAGQAILAHQKLGMAHFGEMYHHIWHTAFILKTFGVKPSNYPDTYGISTCFPHVFPCLVDIPIQIDPTCGYPFVSEPCPTTDLRTLRSSVQPPQLPAEPPPQLPWPLLSRRPLASLMVGDGCSWNSTHGWCFQTP